MKVSFFILLLIVFSTNADFNKGKTFYKEGNLEAAALEFLRDAKLGNAEAQFHIGVLYDRGRGVTQNFKEAAKWFRQAAEQGHAAAQYNLGYLLYKGKGVSKNLDYAYMWFSMSALQGFEGANEPRRRAGEEMTPAQTEMAKTLFNRCVANRYKDCES